MFGKKNQGATIVGAGDRIEGTLTIAGTLHVDGEIRGDVRAEGHVSIGPEGVVEGDLEAHEVTVAGRVEGRIAVSGHLHMLETGLVRGDAFFGSLQVERGGLIHGHTAAASTEEPRAPLGRLPEGDALRASEALGQAEPAAEETARGAEPSSGTESALV
ncbi:MAG: polymer-forming cytoskeletal protein [Myxococcales bacterium]|nr:polymer-forming cytoskeletal protein [Myxococcales bacterium]